MRGLIAALVVFVGFTVQRSEQFVHVGGCCGLRFLLRRFVEMRCWVSRIRDLDDVYFEVQRREEERRQQGLPSLIGILPRNTPAATTGVHNDAEEEPLSATPKPSPVPENKRRVLARNRKRTTP